MKIKDLYTAIEQLNQRQYKYFLNDHTQMSTHILEYNKKEKKWEFYSLDERGNKHDLKIFATEEEACKYVLYNAIEYKKTLHDSWIDAVRRRFE